LTSYSDSKTSEDNIAENDPIRNIPILPTLTSILLEIIQTRDIFHMGFQPEFSECDISVYEFRNYLDIRMEVLQKLIGYQFPHGQIHFFLLNIDKQSEEIDNNIKYFGIPHCWSHQL
jgi:hypothetical protein